MQASLTVHRPGSQRVTLDQLRTLPEPESLGRLHKPVPHYQLVDTISAEIQARGYDITRSQLAVNKGANLLFAVMDLKQAQPLTLRWKAPDPVDEEVGISFGFRNSINKQLNLRGVAGARVWLCDNLCLSGGETVISTKNTLRLNLAEKVSLAVDKFLIQSKILMEDLNTLRDWPLSDTEAKEILYNVFSQGVMSLHLLDDVHMNYFRPLDEYADCQPRTAWGLHNACTRAAKSLKDSQRYNSSIGLGRIFGLATTPATIEADYRR
jgi:hypothetical protein